MPAVRTSVLDLRMCCLPSYARDPPGRGAGRAPDLRGTPRTGNSHPQAGPEVGEQGRAGARCAGGRAGRVLSCSTSFPIMPGRHRRLVTPTGLPETDRAGLVAGQGETGSHTGGMHGRYLRRPPEQHPAVTPGDEAVVIGTQVGGRDPAPASGRGEIRAEDLGGLLGVCPVSLFAGATRRMPPLPSVIWILTTPVQSESNGEVCSCFGRDAEAKAASAGKRLRLVVSDRLFDVTGRVSAAEGLPLLERVEA